MSGFLIHTGAQQDPIGSISWVHQRTQQPGQVRDEQPVSQERQVYLMAEPMITVGRNSPIFCLLCRIKTVLILSTIHSVAIRR